MRRGGPTVLQQPYFSSTLGFAQKLQRDLFINEDNVTPQQGKAPQTPARQETFPADFQCPLYQILSCLVIDCRVRSS